MRINWSRRAIADLKGIADYIEQDSAEAAERVASRIFDRVMSFDSMADRSTPGRVPNTRESFLTPWPYFIIYRVVGDDVRILCIRHSARRWPLRS